MRRRDALLDVIDVATAPAGARPRVGYQGEPGAYSEEALLALYPNAEPVGRRSFTMAFDALLSGEVDLDVLPIENTLGGIVQEVNDLLWERRGLRLIGEYVHPIQHCLLGFPGAKVRRAISHPQALAQTRRYLEARAIEPIPYHDTAGAARYLAEHPEPGLAAVASAAAAQRYGLEVLATGIQDDDTNQTRFVVVQRGEPSRPAGARSQSKCSLCFVAAHVPGSLVAALQCFSARHVNLTRLESRPIPGKPFEYRFFLDFQVTDPEAAEAALCELEATTHEVRLFGTYRPLCPRARG
ncbi:MAG TPA: prephenate dehydratase [Candidatus Dormibacteraeota bacterium]|nr:prephenate dehydratase [Candidatus Dormibacteraeota bacterium]